jgi:hypothetical protein
MYAALAAVPHRYYPSRSYSSSDSSCRRTPRSHIYQRCNSLRARRSPHLSTHRHDTTPYTHNWSQIDPAATTQSPTLIEHCRWPSLALDVDVNDEEVVGWDAAQLKGVTSLLPGGTVRVTSLDAATTLDLAPSRMSFRVRQSTTSHYPPCTAHMQTHAQVTFPALTSSRPTGGGHSEYTYFRITQLFPCARFPSRWDYPLKLAIAFATRHAPPQAPPSALTTTGSSTPTLQLRYPTTTSNADIRTSTSTDTSSRTSQSSRIVTGPHAPTPSLFDVVIELPKLSRPSYPAPITPTSITTSPPASLFAALSSTYPSRHPPLPVPVLPSSAWAPSADSVRDSARELAREWWGASKDLGLQLLHSAAGAMPARVHVACEW